MPKNIYFDGMNLENANKEAEEMIEKKRIAKLEKGENFFLNFGE